MRKIFSLPLLLNLFCGALILLSGCGKEPVPETLPQSAPQKPAPTVIKFGVIPKGTTHEFWKSIQAGALKAAAELSSDTEVIEIIWQGPLREDDREQQVQVVESFLSRGVSGVVLAPLDAKALIAPTEQLIQAGIPVVIFDSDLDSELPASTVSTDNYKGGVMAAEHLGNLLEGRGEVLMLRYAVGSASTEQREKGFLDTIKKKFPRIKIISSDQYAGPTRETAYQAAQNLLSRHEKNLKGIFTPNESSTAGMILALRDSGNNQGKIIHVGFDSGSLLVEALGLGDMQGLVVQDPYQMGYLGVKTIYQVSKGQSVDKRIDTSLRLITPENLDTPESRALINPISTD